MKSIFDKTTRDKTIDRIKSLNEGCYAQWGKMNVSQMVRHCALCEELYQGKLTVKRSFLGRIIGKIALKNLLTDDKPLGRNAPTSSTFIISGHVPDIEAEKERWIALINKYESYNNDYFVHWFFGKMTKEQLGQFIYKHCDHHLRQFNR